MCQTQNLSVILCFSFLFQTGFWFQTKVLNFGCNKEKSDLLFFKHHEMPRNKVRNADSLLQQKVSVNVMPIVLLYFAKVLPILSAGSIDIDIGKSSLLEQY